MSGEAAEELEPARSRSQRRIDALANLRSRIELWVASADEVGGPYLVRAGWARVALGPTATS
jgi:hypothetical protein